MQLKNASESVDDDDTICYATRASVASLLQKVKIFDDDSKSEHLHDFTTYVQFRHVSECNGNAYEYFRKTGRWESRGA